jgi:general stress protein 26
MAEKDVERVWELIASIWICLLSTWNGSKLHSRPMGAFVRRNENAVYFLADRRSHKDDEIRQYPQVCLAFADTRGQKYVSISGRAEVSFDRGKIKELWSIPAKVWWDSPDDPNICVIKVTPDQAEFWDAHGTLLSNVKMAIALATGSHIDAGEHRKTPM